MSVFESEIRAQPEILAARLSQWADVEAAAAALRADRPAALMIAARGTSDHAATYAKYVFEIRNRLPVALAAPSEFTRYASPPNLEGVAVVAISQSGASPDVAAVVEEARRQGRPAVAIVNDLDSPLARAASQVIAMSAGEERSVPASKTYTASLACVAMLSCALSGVRPPVAELDAVSEGVRAVLGADLGPLAAAVTGSRLAVIGRGYHLATAQEVALKVTETAYLLAEARSVADFMHGPVAVVEPGFPVLLLEARGPVLDDMRALRSRLLDQGAALLTITDDPCHPDPAAVQLVTGLPEWLTPVPFAVAGQMLARILAGLRGLDPDRPRGLRKVTSTR